MYEYNNQKNFNIKCLLDSSINVYKNNCTQEMKDELLDFLLTVLDNEELINFNYDDFICNGLQFLTLEEANEIALVNFGHNSYGNYSLVMNEYGEDMLNEYAHDVIFTMKKHFKEVEK